MATAIADRRDDAPNKAHMSHRNPPATAASVWGPSLKTASPVHGLRSRSRHPVNHKPHRHNAGNPQANCQARQSGRQQGNKPHRPDCRAQIMGDNRAPRRQSLGRAGMGSPKQNPAPALNHPPVTDGLRHTQGGGLNIRDKAMCLPSGNHRRRNRALCSTGARGTVNLRIAPPSRHKQPPPTETGPAGANEPIAPPAQPPGTTPTNHHPDRQPVAM